MHKIIGTPLLTNMFIYYSYLNQICSTIQYHIKELYFNICCNRFRAFLVPKWLYPHMCTSHWWVWEMIKQSLMFVQLGMGRTIKFFHIRLNRLFISNHTGIDRAMPNWSYNIRSMLSGGEGTEPNPTYSSREWGDAAKTVMGWRQVMALYTVSFTLIGWITLCSSRILLNNMLSH